MKNKLKLTLPVWSILLIATIIIGGIYFGVYQFQRNPDQDQLSGLTVDSIEAIILDFELMGEQGKRELNKKQIRELIPLLSQVELPGDAYKVGVIGQTKRYIVRTKDGRSFQFFPAADSYCINGHRYYLYFGSKEISELHSQLCALMDKHYKEIYPDFKF